MNFDPGRPFNELPDLPPSKALETKATLKSCIAARVALAELRASGNLIPNQAILINSILILESQASSEIENVVTTTDRLFRYADGAESQLEPATKEALRYRRALRQGFEMLNDRPVSIRMAVEICQTITRKALDIRVTPGTALIDEATQEVVYTPPVGENVIRNKIANWERFIHEAEDVDPLIRLAVMHYQFEAIHPFIDGNGRTGRILNLLYLVDKKLLDVPILYLSRYLLRNKQSYYEHLLEVTLRQDWENWILFMLEAVRSTAEWTTQRILAIRDLLDETGTSIKLQKPKIYSRELVELIFMYPYCRIADIVNAGIAKRQTAAVYLKRLAIEGLLEEIKAGRENLYINKPLLVLLSDRE